MTRLNKIIKEIVEIKKEILQCDVPTDVARLTKELNKLYIEKQIEEILTMPKIV